MTKKTNYMAAKAYGALIGLFLAAGLGMTMLTTAIAYPTQEHRQVAAEFADLNNTALREMKLDIATTPEYERLAQNPHTKYSDLVNFIGTIVQLLVWLALVVYAYRYLRTRRGLVERPTLAVAGAAAIATALAIYPTEMFLRAYGIPSVFSSDAFSFTAVSVSTFLISFLITWLVLKVAEWQYNRSHGFIAE